MNITTLTKKAWQIRRAAASKFGVKIMSISWKICLQMAGEKPTMKTPLEFLHDAGVTDAEIASTDCAAPSIWDVATVTAALADWDDAAVAARRAKRSGPGLIRATKITAARRAWLAANS